MSTPVSIVVPALGDIALLEDALRALAPELERRAAGDELLVVDDTGENRLEPALGKRFPAVRWLASPRNEGFAAALTAGVRAARNELVFALNSDVCVRAGCLEPLVAALEESRTVFAAAPRVLLRGDEQRVESLVELRLEDGIARAAQPGLERSLPRGFDVETTRAVPFAIGGAFLFRRELFFELGGFDPAFAPFYLEDLDLGWRAWKAGFTCLYVGTSIVEHRQRATIGAVVPEPVVLASIERNRLLFTWKHLDDARFLEGHVAALARRVAEAVVRQDRAFLTALCLALEDREEILRKRAAHRTDPSFARIQAASDPYAPH